MRRFVGKMRVDSLVKSEAGKTMVGVAQLVEPRVVIPVVVGSSPIVHPIFYNSICELGL